MGPRGAVPGKTAGGALRWRLQGVCVTPPSAEAVMALSSLHASLLVLLWFRQC